MSASKENLQVRVYGISYFPRDVKCVLSNDLKVSITNNIPEYLEYQNAPLYLKHRKRNVISFILLFGHWVNGG